MMRMGRDRFRQDLIDGWDTFCLASNTAEEWGSPNDPEGFSEEEARSRRLVPLLGPVAFLAEHGDAKSIERDAATLRKAADVLMKAVPGWTDTTVRDLTQQIDQLHLRADAARKAAECLDRSGWRFDPHTKKVRAEAKQKGRHLLTLCVQSLAVEFGTDIEGRRKIANYLSPYFMEKLDPGPRGNIAQALENIPPG